MFLLIPWRVDVPQDRWPVMNWLILLMLVAVFARQVQDYFAYVTEQDVRTHSMQPGPAQPAPAKPAAEQRPKGWSEVPGITHDLILRGWGLKGLLGYMWLHGGLLHLLGNMLFLWVFGNAVCAKIGNFWYLPLYVLLGVAAGIAHLLVSRGEVLGASGAINGVVGAYLMLFYQNEITCLFACWLILPYVRWFSVSSGWMILLWLVWNVVGALLPGGSRVAYFAHLGGFAAGFGITLLLCQKGWITMEKYEKSLLQAWQEHRRDRQGESLDAAYAQVGLHLTEEERRQAASPHTRPAESEIVPASAESKPAPVYLGTDGFIRTACACGYPIRVTRQYAGRTVRCLRCHHPVVIPDKTDLFGPAPLLPPVTPSLPRKTHDTCLHFVCTCGKRMKASAQHAGRTVRCSHCGAKLKIPTIAR